MNYAIPERAYQIMRQRRLDWKQPRITFKVVTRRKELVNEAGGQTQVNSVPSGHPRSEKRFGRGWEGGLRNYYKEGITYDIR